MTDATIDHTTTGTRRPGTPAMLSHVAYITRDTAATADFYTRIMGMELVNGVMDDKIPSTGEDIPYFHSFFRLGDGSTVAFFEAPELPPLGEPPHPAYNTFQHLAFQVDSRETLDGWCEWLRENDVDVLGPVDHKIAFSIYFHDPNGVRLELMWATTPTWNDNGEHAAVQLADWNAVKERAAASGEDMSTEVRRLATERSLTRS